MNVVVGLILATVAISAMIAIRIISSESALNARLKAARSGECDSAPCFGGRWSGWVGPFMHKALHASGRELNYVKLCGNTATHELCCPVANPGHSAESEGKAG